MGEAVNHCDRFRSLVENEISSTLRRVGLQFKNAREVDGCELIYWSPRRDVRIYDSLRNGEINCLVYEKTVGRSTDWVPIRQLVRYGEGLSDEQLEALMPDDFPSEEESIREIGQFLLQLEWD